MGTSGSDQKASGIRFSVDQVDAASTPLWMSTLGESLELRSGSSILFMPDRDLPALASEGYFRGVHERRIGDAEKTSPRPLRKGRLDRAVADELATLRQSWRHSNFVHPLVQAVHLAFSEHRPLILSPDAIWLTIVQGFGHHLHEHAEELRDRVVAHQGKKTLRVTVVPSDPNCWPGLTAELSRQIRDNSDPVLHETLLCDFSTTTPIIRTSCEIALMDAYERYFEYVFLCVCGIPEITLEGTIDDWERMRQRAEVLATYDLDWWVSKLRPILDQFVATANGNPDRDFWRAIYKPERAYFSELASGWITDLFPYLSEAPQRRRNSLLEKPRVDWVPMSTKQAGVSLDSFPSGISRAPLRIESPREADRDVALIGGLVGVGQRSHDYALYPLINWAVVEAHPCGSISPQAKDDLLQYGLAFPPCGSVSCCRLHCCQRVPRCIHPGHVP